MRDATIEKFEDIIQDTDKARLIEKNIYNYALKIADEQAILKRWDNPMFSVIYADKARDLLTNIDPVSKSTNNDNLLIKIQLESIDSDFFSDLIYYDPQKQFPEHWQAIMDSVDKQEQELLSFKPKTSDEYVCHKCKKRETTYYSVQTRSVDESSTIYITCQPCGYRWTINP